MQKITFCFYFQPRNHNQTCLKKIAKICLFVKKENVFCKNSMVWIYHKRAWQVKVWVLSGTYWSAFAVFASDFQQWSFIALQIVTERIAASAVCTLNTFYLHLYFCPASPWFLTESFHNPRMERDKTRKIHQFHKLSTKNGDRMLVLVVPC